MPFVNVQHARVPQRCVFCYLDSLYTNATVAWAHATHNDR